MIGEEDFPTDTSQWTLAIHRVTTTSVEIWVGTLFPSLEMPARARVELTAPDGSVIGREIRHEQWQRPFRKLAQRFYALLVFEGLKPASRYEVRFCRRIEAIPGVRPESWQGLRSGVFETLPERLPLKGEKPFVMALGSCFFPHRDGGQAAAAYKALYERGPIDARPDIAFLAGDQVYLDIGFDSLSSRSDEIRQRIAADYAENWRALGSILNRGATWLLPDDHEYWNDYPFHDSLLPTLLALNIPKVRRVWEETARDGVQHIQRTLPVETFALGEDLSVCVADLRSHRSWHGFARAEAFARLCHWAETLNSPGVLVLSQPLLVEPGLTERTLANFREQYRELVLALATSGHDVVVLAGDVHYGRIATAPLGDRGAKLVEVLSSPLSNLTGLDGVATAVADRRPRWFPPRQIWENQNWRPQRVVYNRRYRVSARKGRVFSAYPRARTREHFMTVAFSRLPAGGIELSVQAWRVRQRTPGQNLPVREFVRPFRCTLR